jgi:hypothetical protein
VGYIHNGLLLSYKEEEWNYVICRKMNRAKDQHVKKNKPHWKDKHHIFSLIWESRAKKIKWHDC